MKVYPDKLETLLQRGTAPVYLVHGDEPLQAGEITDRLRRHAREAGFDEREVVVAETDDDWARLREAGDSLSLFAARRLVELRLPTGKPGRVGGPALIRWAEDAPPDVLLLIQAGKLDRGGAASAWFKAIDKVGVTVAVQPIGAAVLPRWLDARLARHGLQATPDALALVCERVEGNLLAASQEVERLGLLYPPGVLEASMVLDAVADSSRYAIGDLAPAVLRGETARALKILRGLAATDEAPTLVLWALNQEIRGGARAAETHARGAGLDTALKNAGVWANRQPDLKLAIARHPVTAWLGFLAEIARIDRMIKGREEGDVWNAFESLCAALADAGHSPVTPRTAPIP